MNELQHEHPPGIPVFFSILFFFKNRNKTNAAQKTITAQIIMFAIILASQNFCFLRKGFLEKPPAAFSSNRRVFCQKTSGKSVFQNTNVFILNNALPGCPAVLIHHFFRIHFCIRISSEKSKKHCRKENNRKHRSGSKMSLREQYSKLIDN